MTVACIPPSYHSCKYEEYDMAGFAYVAHPSDGSQNTRSGRVTAENKTEAEKKVRAKYNYPVRIVWADDLVQYGGHAMNNEDRL
jgi:type II secretory pathway component PulF